MKALLYIHLIFAPLAPLSSEDYNTRIKAEECIRKAGEPAVPTLEIGRRLNDYDLRRACTSLRSDIYSALPEARVWEIVNTFPSTSIDGWWYDVETGWYSQYKYENEYDLMHPYLEWSRTVPYTAQGKYGFSMNYPWDAYYKATQKYIYDEIRAGRDIDDLRKDVQTAWHRDQMFLWRFHTERGCVPFYDMTPQKMDLNPLPN